MKRDERLDAFLRTFDAALPDYLEQLFREAKADAVPVIRADTRSLLRLLLRMKQPMQILEIGTAVGCSALLMREFAPKGAKITTIENYEKRIPIAKANFKAYDRSGQIRLLEGDAGEILKELKGSFDFIFLDAAKGQYLSYLPELLRLMRPGAVLISDNILQEGDILESRFAVERRNRTIHSRMREYLYVLNHTKALSTTVLPVGDGVSISVREETADEDA